jgi:hypothetical protein
VGVGVGIDGDGDGDVPQGRRRGRPASTAGRVDRAQAPLRPLVLAPRARCTRKAGGVGGCSGLPVHVDDVRARQRRRET